MVGRVPPLRGWHHEGVRVEGATASGEPAEGAAAGLVRGAGGEIVARRVVPPAPGAFEPLPALPAGVLRALGDEGISRLYRHQRAAIDEVLAGRDVLLTTGTASGKSLAYALPALAGQSVRPGATTLALYPTKALAHDQAQSLARLGSAAGLAPGSVASYDGDTAAHRRSQVRAGVRTLVTNPDMLHAGILPHHTLWRRFLQGLELVVIDEIHTYRGVFGGHLAGVVRRLMRLARHYGSAPTFVLTSATLGNPCEHARALTGREVVHVSEDAAPRDEREVLLYLPPIVDRDLALRRPPASDAVAIAERLAGAGRQVLVFAGSRQGAEEAVLGLRRRVQGVRTYRSGLLASERREIERELRDGSARVVVATNALELGIDVGGVDAVIVVGYPGSSAAFWQQVGRAGRRGRRGLGVLVLGSGPLDQYLARHPHHLFDAPPERALTDPDHLLLALDHLRCAAFELPIEPDETFGAYGRDEVGVLVAQLRSEGEVHVAGGRGYWLADHYPAASVALRSAGRDEVALIADDGEAIGTLDAPGARWMAHPGAVYLHDGRPYLVHDLDLAARTARLAPTDDRYLTRATRETRIDPAGELQRRPERGVAVFEGEVTVTDTVTGFRRVRRATGETVGRHPLALEPSSLRTTAYGFAPNHETVESLRRAGAWGNDANDYGRDWKAVRAAVLARDGRRCRTCGTREEAGGPMHVHHVVPFRAFADAAEANRPDNLVTLCPPCHARAEQVVRVRSGLAAVAYTLRSLAPLLMMCDARDLGVHSDPASSLAAGGPALVIFETVPGGVGFAAELSRRHLELVAAAREVVRDCECHDGCPGCVGPAGEPGHAGKREAAALLEALA